MQVPFGHTARRVDYRVDALAQIVVRQTDHGAGSHRWVFFKCCFDFCRVNICPTTQNQILTAVGEVDVTLRVH